MEIYIDDDYLTEQDYKVAQANGISPRNAYQRVHYYQWDTQRAITEPLREYIGTWQEWKETCAKNGISNPCFNARLKKGMLPEEAATLPVGKRGR